jgi:hypothetical protein
LLGHLRRKRRGQSLPHPLLAAVRLNLPSGQTCIGAAASVSAMADPFSADAFYASAKQFAVSALQAHHAGDHRRVSLDAGTALEHLSKASLAHRSPALLAELRGESSLGSVAALLGIAGFDPAKVRTVGLMGALDRAGHFVRSRADMKDLRTLADLRNGIVHAAGDTEIEERILAAFLQHCDAILADLGRDRADFWDGQLPVVDVLIRDASDKVAQRVEVRLAAAEAWLEQRCATDGEALIAAARTLSSSAPLTDEQRFRTCPVCGSAGITTGEHGVEYEPDDWDRETGQVTQVDAQVWFTARAYRCPVCRLRLDSVAEIDKAFDPVWQIEDADWRDYEPGYYDADDDAYERRREDRHGL